MNTAQLEAAVNGLWFAYYKDPKRNDIRVVSLTTRDAPKTIGVGKRNYYLVTVL